jgi:O-methyltransferase involved in polyketide biosynthesis
VHQIEAVVNLGAGFDTRPYRLSALANAPAWEVDQAILASNRYSLDKRTFFILEAVTQYVVETGIRAIFDLLATAAPGSRLAFTYIRQDFLYGQNIYGQERLYKRYIVKDKIWLFGMDPQEVTEFLKPYGWRVIEHRGYEDLTVRYVKPTGRVLVSMPIERLVYAEKL